MVGARARDTVIVGGFVAVLVLVTGVVGFIRLRGGGPNPDDPLAGVTMPATPARASAPSSTGAEPALAAYDGYWQAYVAAAAQRSDDTADLEKSDLDKYLADPLLTSVRAGLVGLRSDGIVYKGRPRWTPRATAINLDAKPPSVTMVDCFALDTWEPVFVSSGKSALAQGQPTRYVITSTAKRFESIGWLLTDSLADRSRSC